MPIIRLDHSNTRCRSSIGIPSSSAMATSGSSAATAATNSISPAVIACVDEAPGHLAVVVGELSHRLGCEPPINEAAQAGVLGRVHLEHHPSQFHVGALSGQGHALGRRVRVPLTAHRHDVVVPRDRPEPVDLVGVAILVTEDRHLAAQPVESVEGRAVEVEVVALDVEVEVHHGSFAVAELERTCAAPC